MPVLKNARHEKYAQSRAKGKSIDDAYVEAGYSRNSGNATRMNGIESIKQRVMELQQEAATNTGITIEYVAEKARTLLERCMQAEEVKDSKGVPTGEYRFDSAGANSALEKLAKHCGFYEIDNKQKAPVSKIGTDDMLILARFGITIAEEK